MGSFWTFLRYIVKIAYKFRRKEDIIMEQKKTNQKVLYILIWANIRKYQYANGMSNAELAEVLEVCPRTLYTYNKDPRRLSTERMQLFIEKTGVTKENLIAD